MMGVVMSHRQTRIFVPADQPFNNGNWVETLVGSVIAPLVRNSDSLMGFWFSRYVDRRSDSGDCDIDLIPQEFGINDTYQPIGLQGFYRSLRFRYEVEDESLNQFEQLAGELIENNGCVISDFRDYPFIEDLGGDRFIGGERTDPRRQQRAQLIQDFFLSACMLFIHCLTGPDEHGQFQIEVSDNNQNRHGSIFESAHHLFCNITNVPLSILISEHGIGTDWYPPQMSEGSNPKVLRIKF